MLFRALSPSLSLSLAAATLAAVIMLTLSPQSACLQPRHKHTNENSSSKCLAHLCRWSTSAASRTTTALKDGPGSCGSDKIVTSDVLSLDSIRSTLVRQEETIIFALIERAQFRRNDAIYSCGDHLVDEDGAETSFFSFMLRETEKLHAKVRRYTSPEEHPFTKGPLPSPILKPLNFPRLLCENSVNVNSEILEWYTDKIIPALCVAGDDEQHGSSVLCDITALQALSRRIHLGKFVAESKFAADPETYREMLENDDVKGIVDSLTNVAVEQRVLQRAYLKTSTYGMDISGETQGYKVDPGLIVSLYREMIIPLTKHVEVQYLYQRVNKSPPTAETYMHICRSDTSALDVNPLALELQLEHGLRSRHNGNS